MISEAPPDDGFLWDELLGVWLPTAVFVLAILAALVATLGGFTVTHVPKPPDPTLWQPAYCFPGGPFAPVGSVTVELCRTDLILEL